MQRSSAPARVWALAVMLAGPAGLGCSFLVVSAPPVNHRDLSMFDCGGSVVPPIADTALTAGGILLTSAAFGLCGLSDGVSSTGCQERVGLVMVPLTVLLPLGSAVYGYVEGARCREAKDELMARSFQPPPAGAPAAPPSRSPYDAPATSPAPAAPPANWN